MADGRFHVDTDGLNGQLPHVQQLAARFRDIHSGLAERLEALGACWGDDAGGRQFYEQYARPGKQVLEGTADMGRAVDGLHDGIRTMAVNFDRLEAKNIEAAHALRSRSAEVSAPRGGRTGRA